MKRAIYRYTVFFMVGILFSALLIPLSHTSWAEGRRTFVAELRAKRRAAREPQQTQENTAKETPSLAAATDGKRPESAAPAAGERRGGGHGPHGGSPRFRGPRLGPTSYQQLGKSFAYAAVPCFATIILLTGWQRLTQPRKRREG